MRCGPGSLGVKKAYLCDRIKIPSFWIALTRPTIRSKTASLFRAGRLRLGGGYRDALGPLACNFCHERNDAVTTAPSESATFLRLSTDRSKNRRVSR